MASTFQYVQCVYTDEFVLVTEIILQITKRYFLHLCSAFKHSIIWSKMYCFLLL